MCAHRRVPKFWGRLGPHYLLWGTWLTLETRVSRGVSHVRYHTNFGRSRSNRMGVSRGLIALGDRAPPLTMEASLTLEIRPSHTCITTANLVAQSLMIDE